jgi:RNA polymerase sigma factor (sigma-70 family)
MSTLRNTLVEQYMSFAKKLAYQRKRTLPAFVDVDELISAAYMGLIEAADRYDESFNVRFTTYAYPRIFGAIQDHLREQGWIKRETSFPTDEDGCTYEPAAPSEPNSVDEMMEVVTNALGEQSATILRPYFVEQCTMKEVGDKVGLTEGRISQIIKDYKSQIRHRYEQEELSELLAA